MKASSEAFTIKPAERRPTPCMVSIVGRSSSGKTYSALRLAFGMQKVSGGLVGFLDTENGRGTHYVGDFPEYLHLPLEAKSLTDKAFGSLRYLAAVEALIEAGCRTVVIDSMSHEHEGPGGYLDSAGFFDGMVPQHKWKQPAAHRQMMINRFCQLPVNLIMCFRAKEKREFAAAGGSGEAKSLGLQPISNEGFMFEMLCGFLLHDHANGCPTWSALRAQEHILKLPKQYLHLFGERGKPPPTQMSDCSDHVQLSEDIGEAIAAWSYGKTASTAPTVEKLVADFDACADADVRLALVTETARLNKLSPSPYTKDEWKAISEASKRSKVRLEATAVREPGEDDA